VPADDDPERPSACDRCGRVRAGVPPRCPACGGLERAAACPIHRDRLTTSACVICGTAVCHECRRGGRHAALCARHERVSVIEGWAEALRTSDELEARWLADLLRESGIEAQVLSQKDRANVVTFGGLSVVRLLVPSVRLDEALDVIGSGRDAAGGPGRPDS
jgi:hypothetical protein